MKVHLIRKETIEEYAKHNARSRPSSKLNYADWKIPGDMQDIFNSADLLGNGSDRVVLILRGIITG